MMPPRYVAIGNLAGKRWQAYARALAVFWDDPGESDVALRAVFGPEEVDEGAPCDTCGRPVNGDDPGEGLEALFALARRHGEVDDPDHEVGDLQDLCRVLWDLLTPRQRGQAVAALRGEDDQGGAAQTPPPA